MRENGEGVAAVQVLRCDSMFVYSVSVDDWSENP